ncbi:MAG: hypothetical protein RL380_1538, partial [Verrucomicrobiota bacterium]
MSNGNSPTAAAKSAAKKTSTPPVQPGQPLHVAPLFRKIDWVAFFVATLVVFAGYLWTLAPDLTLEDSGELAVGSFYAGIPHPPGYPVWTMYTWLFAKLVPISNIAYRVAMACALSGAVACGLLAMLVSRGSSMMIEGIDGLKNLERRTENLICLVAGYVAAILIGFNGYMWSQAIIVEVYPFGVLSLMGVLLCMLRWIYAPHQRRYLYGALFLFGICFTNHQSLLACAMGIEIAIACGQPKLGRDMFFGNSIIYVGYNLFVAFSGHQIFQNLSGGMMHHLFHAVGVGSIIACVWLTIKTGKLLTEWLPVVILGVAFILGAAFYFYMPLAGMSTPPMQWGYPRTLEGFIHALTRGQYEQPHPTDIFKDPLRVVMQLGILLGGVSDEFGWLFTTLALVPFLYFFKMQRRERAWVIGLFSIYLCLGPLLMILFNLSPDRSAISLTKVFFTASHVMISLFAGYGVTLVTASLAANFSGFRSIGIIGGVAAVDFAVLTIIAAVQHLHGGQVEADTTLIYGRWKLICWLLIGFCYYFKRRPDMDGQQALFTSGIILGLIATVALTSISIIGNAHVTGSLGGVKGFFSTFGAAFHPDQYALPVFSGLMLLGLSVIFLLLVLGKRERLPMGLILLLFAIAPANSFICHWAENEQRGHMFGFWFGHDMFTPPFAAKDGQPLYPEMARDAILYGGTDPGRFCPTYMIFAESFIPDEKKFDPKFDRRDVYIITQNALADGTYLMYIRSHYNRSSQKAMRMDTPFFQDLLRGSKEKAQGYKTNLVAKLIGKPLDDFFLKVGESIEKERRVGSSYFQPADFTDLKALTARLQAQATPVAKQVFNALSAPTKSLLTGGNENQLRQALATDLNRLLDAGLYDDKELVKLVTDRFPAIFEWEKAKGRRREIGQTQTNPDLVAQLTAQADATVAAGQQRVDGINARLQSTVDAVVANLTANGIPLDSHLKKFIAEAPHEPRNFTRVRLMRQLLEAAFPKELAISPGGTYPDTEMYISTPEDSAQCFADYMADASRRAQAGQLKPGENVQVADGKLQVSGQVAVMSINGFISKNMFDENPDNEFYVEESFPMDWMYPHLTPFGVIMKVNRQPLAEISQEICDRDHDFWTQYSKRFIGDWINYDTSVKDVCDWAEKTYLRHDYSGFKGDRAFVRDDSGQKAFSKLRSSIASSIYVHRAGKAKSTIEQGRMVKEADFALKQAFAFCPYSPEAVYNYVQLLANTGRGADAILIARTAVKLDPYNDAFANLVKSLESYPGNQPAAAAPPTPSTITLANYEAELKKNPDNFQNAFDLAAAYHQMGRTNEANTLLDQVATHPKADARVLLTIAQANAAMGDYPALEKTLARIVVLAPDDPENWYNLAALKSVIGKKDEALAALQKFKTLNVARLAKDPKARDLLAEAAKDPRFDPIRTTPEFQTAVA